MNRKPNRTHAPAPALARTARPRGGQVNVTWTCACGRPEGSTEFEMLERTVPCAAALRLEVGELACPTCHDCATVIYELTDDEPIGECKKILVVEFVRIKEAVRVSFDKDAEKRREREEQAAERARERAREIARANEAATAPPSATETMDLEAQDGEDGDGAAPAPPSDHDSSSDDDCGLDFS